MSCIHDDDRLRVEPADAITNDGIVSFRFGHYVRKDADLIASQDCQDSFPIDGSVHHGYINGLNELERKLVIIVSDHKGEHLIVSSDPEMCAIVSLKGLLNNERNGIILFYSLIKGSS